MNWWEFCKTVRKADNFESPSRPNSGKAACLFEIAGVLVRLRSHCPRHRKRGSQTIWIVDAHRDDGKRFIVRVDELLTAFVELEAAIRG